MTDFNPLKKYYRQPKIYISLPSKGQFYPPGSIEGDLNHLPIFGMTGMDEILFKTPDALFNGDASSKVIESCCPAIKDAKSMPSIDVDAVLMSIRIATYGEGMTVGHTCKNCGAENEFEIDLSTILDYFNNLKYDTSVPINELTVNVKPLSYKEMTEFGVENFKLQRMLYQTNSMPEEEQQEHISKIYQQLADLQISLFMLSITKVVTPDGEVRDPEMIQDWLRNADKSIYAVIKSHLEKNKEVWSIPASDVACTECGTADKLEISLDQSNFFG